MERIETVDDVGIVTEWMVTECSVHAAKITSTSKVEVGIAVSGCSVANSGIV